MKRLPSIRAPRETLRPVEPSVFAPLWESCRGWVSWLAISEALVILILAGRAILS